MENFSIKGKVLEAGCGMGGPLYCLSIGGYNAVGIDFAQETLIRVKNLVPTLELCNCDIRFFPYKAHTFQAIWSIGVIEHFEAGYEDMVNEMSRIIEPGGYVFISFPWMSPLRKFKEKLMLYESKMPDETYQFYQFALNYEDVITDFNRKGFILIDSIPYDGIKGTKDEIAVIKPVLQKLYDYSGSNIKIYKLRRTIDWILKIYGSHMILLIFQKNFI